MNLNPIDISYIDGKNSFPIQDYVDEQLNNLVLNQIYTSNVILNDNKKLNNVLYYIGGCNLNNSTNHLILSNNYNFGEIQFDTFFKYANSNQIGTKIDYTGKLFLYHNYNILQPTILEGYYDMDYEVAQLKADGVATDLQLTGIEGAIVTINNDITALNLELISIYNAFNLLNGNIAFLQEEIDFIAGELEQRAMVLQSSQSASEIMDGFVSYLHRDRDLIGNSVNKFVQYGLVGAGLGVVGAIFGFLYNTRMSNMAVNIQSSNYQITTGDRSNLIYQADSQNVLYANQYISNTYNLNVNQGFINSNILTTQTIPNILTNIITVNNNSTNGIIKLIGNDPNLRPSITFNNGTSMAYIGLGGANLINHANNLVLNSDYGIVFNTSSQNNIITPSMCINYSGNVGINVAPTNIPLGNKLYVNGNTYLNGTLNTTSLTTNSIIYNSQQLSTTLNNYLLLSGGTLSGSLTLNTQIYGNPGPYPQGFNGDRIILQTGIGTNGYPYSIGIGTGNLTNNTFWNCAPSNASYKWYSGASNTMILDNTGQLQVREYWASGGLTINGNSELLNYSCLGYPYYNFDGVSQTAIFADNNSPINLILSSVSSNYGASLLLANDTGTSSYLLVGGSATTPNLFRENLAIVSTYSLILNAGNHASETPDFIIDSFGNIGIGTTANSSYKLLTNGEIKSKGLTVDNANGAYLTLTASNPAVDSGIYLYNTSAPGVAGYIGIGGTTLANLVSRSNLTITSKNSIVFNNFSSPTASMIIDNNGNTTINGTLNIKSFSINNWLFNNTGGIHGDLGDFNLVTTAGYKFIVGNINSPSTSYSQYYSWLVGIGSNYPVTGTGSYSCQFAIPRLPTNNPRLFIRYNENNSWGGWNGIIASSADALTSGNKTISGDLSITGTLSFGSRVQDFLIYLWGTSYGFGINSDTLRYNCHSTASHKFYSGSTNTATIDGSGNLTTTGYVFAGGTTSGLRINGNDYGNTIYQNAVTIGTQPASIGFTLRDNNLFNFWSLSSTGGGYTNIANMNTSAINLNKNVTITGDTTINGTLSTNQFYTNSINQIITKTISIAPTSTAYNGYWQINIDAYKIVNQYNYLIFSCSMNYAGTIGYWTGKILVNGNGSGSIISLADFNTTNIFLSYINLGGILYLWVNANGFYPTTNSLLYYKIIG